MRFRVTLLKEAHDELIVILGWLSRRSLSGAATWERRWQEVVSELEESADACSPAPDAKGLFPLVRHCVFKTRKGLRYRTLFTICDQEVIILHLRGPGQDLIAPDEIRRP